MIKTILVFIIIFSILVVFHEFGHYYWARKAGIQVREFSLGMGPKVFAKQGEDGTTYTVRMLPLGGYVRMAGLSEEEELKPGMQVGLEINSDDQVSLINLSGAASAVELPVQINEADLVYDMYIDAIPLGSTDMVRYSVARDANVMEEDGTIVTVAPIEHRYESATPLQKMVTNLAGPVNNFILSIVVYIIVAFMAGGVPDYGSATIGQVAPDSAAYEAGIQSGDQVVSVDGQAVDNWSDLVVAIQGAPDEDLALVVDRQGQSVDLTLRPEAVTNEQTGEEMGQAGIQIAMKTGVWDKIKYGFTQTWAVIAGVFSAIVNMVLNGFNINNFGGPIAMAQMTNEVVSTGTMTILSFMAMLSANLGAFNLLPIPALDGGKILFNLVELVRGKPVKEETEGIITLVGVVLLLILMVAVTWNDIQRAFFR